MKNLFFLFAFIGAVLFAGCSDDDSEITELPKVFITGSNLYYNEVQVGNPQHYWVNLDDSQSRETESIVWYVNGSEMGKGAQFKYTPSVAGNYVIKYAVKNGQSREVSVKAYSSKGILILNEPNMSASEETRGVNSFLFGGTTVDRFIQGNYQQFGATAQFIANWSGKLYCISPYTQSGVAFSQFKEDGTFIKAIAALPNNEMGRAFAGIDQKRGILTTAKNAYLVDLDNFTIDQTPLKLSANAANVFVADGYVFLIAGGKVLAYKADGLSANTNPVVLGNGTAGFVQSMDGAVWAANGNEFLRIKTADLSSEVLPIPDGVVLKFSNSPWKQCSFVASTKENALFFTNDGGWGTAKFAYKYDIDSKTLKELFSGDNVDNYMLYSTSLLYDTERDELICSAIKGYGSDSAYNGLFFFDAKAGTLKSKVLYVTAPATSKDMWFPAMMAQMKN